MTLKVIKNHFLESFQNNQLKNQRIPQHLY